MQNKRKVDGQLFLASFTVSENLPQPLPLIPAYAPVDGTDAKHQHAERSKEFLVVVDEAALDLEDVLYGAYVVLIIYCVLDDGLGSVVVHVPFEHGSEHGLHDFELSAVEPTVSDYRIEDQQRGVLVTLVVVPVDVHECSVNLLERSRGELQALVWLMFSNSSQISSKLLLISVDTGLN